MKYKNSGPLWENSVETSQQFLFCNHSIQNEGGRFFFKGVTLEAAGNITLYSPLTCNTRHITFLNFQERIGGLEHS